LKKRREGGSQAENKLAKTGEREMKWGRGFLLKVQIRKI